MNVSFRGNNYNNPSPPQSGATRKDRKMKALKSITITLCGAFALGIVATAMFPTGTTLANGTPSGQRTAVGQTKDKDLEGSWLVNVVFPDGYSFPTLMTAIPGGGVLFSFDNTGPWLWPTAHGNWARTDRSKYSFTDVGFATDKITGELVFQYETIGEIELNEDRDKFTGRVSYGAALEGTRIAIKPMP